MKTAELAKTIKYDDQRALEAWKKYEQSPAHKAFLKKLERTISRNDKKLRHMTTDEIHKMALGIEALEKKLREKALMLRFVLSRRLA